MLAYAQPIGTITNSLDRLRHHITQVPERLEVYTDDELTQKAPGKWSKREMLGHLIDSAINNLKRFTDAQVTDGPYKLQGYDQNQLVILNRYQQLPIDHLLGLWRSLNQQILYVAEVIPVDILAKPVQFSQANATDQTLGWLIEDYVAHLEHHLKTLL